MDKKIREILYQVARKEKEKTLKLDDLVCNNIKHITVYFNIMF